MRVQQFFLWLIIVSVIFVLACSRGQAAGTTYNSLTDDQKQAYWDCWNHDCKDLLQKSKSYTACGQNCLDSAKKSTLALWCNDTDKGKDFFIKGTVYSNIYKYGKEDYCYSATNGKAYLFEGICKNNKYSAVQKNCAELGSDYYCDATEKICKKKPAPTVEAYLIYWGDHYTSDEVQQKIIAFQKYFNEKTTGVVLLNLTYGGQYSLPPEDAQHDYSATAEQYNLDLNVAKNIWYETHEAQMLQDIKQVIAESSYNPAVQKAALIFTDISYPTTGQIYKTITNSPPIIVFKSANYEGYQTGNLKIDYLNDGFLSDVLSHELGHFMGLAHACALTPCSECAYPNDIMSYCRNKGSSENKFFSCSLNKIKTYAKNYPWGTICPEEKTFSTCDDLSKTSLCFNVKCNNYCDNAGSYFLGGNCDFSSGKCLYKTQPNSAFCSGGCTKVLSRTNIATGVYSGLGIDDNSGWVAVNLASQPDSLTAFGWSYLVDKTTLNLQLIGFTWDGFPLRINADSSKELIIEQPGKIKAYLYSQDSPAAKNAFIDKESIGSYQALEFVGSCQNLVDPCKNKACPEDCDSLSGDCVKFDECADYCDFAAGTWYYNGKYSLQTKSCDYQAKEKSCGKYQVISRTNVLNGEYNTQAQTKDDNPAWVVIREGGPMTSLKYLQETSRLPWRTYTLLGYTWDNKPIEKEYYFGDYNKYLIDGKHLFESASLDYAINSTSLYPEYFELEYHQDPKNIPNPCKNVLCKDYCDAGTLNYQGYCNYLTAQCDYRQQAPSILCSSDCKKVLSRTNKLDGQYDLSASGTSDGKASWLSLMQKPGDQALLATGFVAVAGQLIKPDDRKDYPLAGYTWDLKPVVQDPSDPTIYLVDYKGKYTTASPAKDNALTGINPIIPVQEFSGLNCAK